MPRIFLLSSDLHARPLRITGDKARYLSTVLRSRAGDSLVIHDDHGNSYAGRVTSATGREVTVDLIGKIACQGDSPLSITLLQGLLKGEKMDLVVQKATELGVMDIIPVITERSQVRQTRKIPRWTKIAEEAARQSGRSSVPRIHQTMEFDGLPPAAPSAGIIFWEEGGADLGRALTQCGSIGPISLFTGPEGGFSEREITAASEKGFIVATLGRRILRAETAAITAVAITQFVLGDLGA